MVRYIEYAIKPATPVKIQKAALFSNRD